MFEAITTPELQFLGIFNNGKVSGNFWLGLLNNGYIHGMADEYGRATGNEIAFIYPDGETALKGTYVDKYMKTAYEVKVETYTCNEFGILQAIKFSKRMSSVQYSYNPCTNFSFGGTPTISNDPYEIKYVEAKESNVGGGGSGIFAKHALHQGRIACFYSLFLYRHNDQLELFHKTCSYDTSKSDHYRRQCSKYSIKIVTYHGTINLPPELDHEHRLPTLGPKVNHHFKANNSIYIETEHPVWGLIMGVVPTIDIAAGQELYTYYNYEKIPSGVPQEFPNDFPWYWEEKMKADRETRLQVEANSKS